MTVIYRYLDCGDLHMGFARVRCEECGHEYLLAFSCKRRQFCPSCHQKRVIEYGEWLLTNVLKDVPHRQWVFSIPKRLRIYFHMAPEFFLKDLEEIFQYEVLKMLKKEGKITDAVIENMLSWRHSGFHVYIGGRISSDDKAGLGNLARYIIRACFSQERMVYIPAEASDDKTAKVVYISKDRKSRKTFNTLDWLARLVTHIPGRYEQTVRYYGYYSNKSRGMRKKTGTDDNIPAVMPNEMSSKESRQNWARLMRWAR